jgi:hypothetical protein
LAPRRQRRNLSSEGIIKNLSHLSGANIQRQKLFALLGAMDATKEGSPWPGYIEKAVAGLHDKGIYTHFFRL